MSINNQKINVRRYNVAQQYQVREQVGRGAYGKVYKVLSKSENKFYALKQYKFLNADDYFNGFPTSTLREIFLIKKMRHPNIIKLRQLVFSKPNPRNSMHGSTFLVLQYMEHDLAGLLNRKIQFSLPQIKCIMKQILEGVGYLHSRKVLHRDLKPSNILLNNQGQVKIADFGLARQIIKDKPLTQQVVTFIYRAPQLFFRNSSYDQKIDMWSIGCIFAQFFIKKILFDKYSESQQIQYIFQICGDFVINKVPEDTIKKMKKYRPPIKNYELNLENHIRSLCTKIPGDALNLLLNLLSIDPNKRPSCAEALNHQFFRNQPLVCERNLIKKFQFEYHEMMNNEKINLDKEKKQFHELSHRGQRSKNDKDRKNSKQRSNINKMQNSSKQRQSQKEKLRKYRSEQELHINSKNSRNKRNKNQFNQRQRNQKKVKKGTIQYQKQQNKLAPMLRKPKQMVQKANLKVQTQRHKQPNHEMYAQDQQRQQNSQKQSNKSKQQRSRAKYDKEFDY